MMSRFNETQFLIDAMSLIYKARTGLYTYIEAMLNSEKSPWLTREVSLR